MERGAGYRLYWSEGDGYVDGRFLSESDGWTVVENVDDSFRLDSVLVIRRADISRVVSLDELFPFLTTAPWRERTAPLPDDVAPDLSALLAAVAGRRQIVSMWLDEPHRGDHDPEFVHVERVGGEEVDLWFVDGALYGELERVPLGAIYMVGLGGYQATLMTSALAARSRAP